MKENISSGVGWTAGVIDSAVTCGANEWPIWTRYTVIRGHAPGGISGGWQGATGGVSGGCQGATGGREGASGDI